jgi:hypothetical protein
MVYFVNVPCSEPHSTHADLQTHGIGYGEDLAVVV